MSLPSLRDLIDQHFNAEELRQLCLDVGVAYENLVGETRIMKAQSLVEHCLRHGLLLPLTSRCQTVRPRAAWPDAQALEQEWNKVQQGLDAQENLRDLLPAAQVEAPLALLQAKERDLLAQLVGSVAELAASQSYSWEKHYLQTLLGYCEPLDLAAIDELYGEQKPIRVSDVFTSLSVGRGGKTAVSTIANSDRLVILGYPGGGKSTLVNYLAAQMARRRLGQPADPLDGWKGGTALLPVRIILRHFAAALPAHVPPGKKGGLVWDYLQHHLLPQWGCQEAFTELKRLLTEEGGLILFDGLDEVAESDADTRRSLLKEAIADFAAPLEQCKVVVTCREYAYKQGDAWHLPQATFPVVDLQLFAPEQVEQFTQTWYRLTGPLKGWDGDRCQREAERLYTASQQQPHLRELAQYPLLLTLMAQVHGRDGTLPEDRADLYERAVNLLLAHWENRIEREVDGGRRVEPGLIARLGVKTEVLKGALARVAFQAHEQQGAVLSSRSKDKSADISRDLLWEELHAALGSYDRAKQVTDYVEFRAGLLQARDRFTYTFPHRTFQEYLAAWHIWQTVNPGELLLERLRRDLNWWREVFLLAAGQQKQTPRNVAELVDWLPSVAAGDTVIPEQVTLAMLAEQALYETGFMTHTRPEQPQYRFTAVVARVQDWLLAAMLAEGQVPVKERAAVGRILCRLRWPDGMLLDNRPGVGVVLRDEQLLPDIAWGKTVPAGTYQIGEGQQRRQVTITKAYQLSRYPVTFAQFDCFVQAADFDDSRWWEGMPEEDAAYGSTYKLREQAFPYANHPREMISWYQAMAFCRWLNDKLANGTQINLPHEDQWEVAARYPDGRLFPWGNDFAANKANTYEGSVKQTTAVGLYPAGKQPHLELYDLSGNVWEWCRNKYDDPAMETPDRSGDWRALRGGSWFSNQDLVRSSYRLDARPNDRSYDGGFRLVRLVAHLIDH
ncbi:MAG: SUMF1/EgtB/PvdO family nonheme iron enzyme [Ardenticatenaceae bacterium]|nr:SUMF1/EgtB/PvdO family nonheme iron enzyme [Ardenticatenaceae bacterium]